MPVTKTPHNVSCPSGGLPPSGSPNHALLSVLGFLNIARSAFSEIGIDLYRAISGGGQDLASVREHLERHPGTLNKYNLAANMFLRFVTKIGVNGLEVSQRQGKAILNEICLARRGESTENSGKPIFVGSPRNAEIKNALGRFFAEPAPEGGFYIKELYDFDRGDPRGTFGSPFRYTFLVGADGTVKVIR